MNIEQLIQLSPVPVEFVNDMENPNWCGVYYQGKNKGYIGKARIEILDELDEQQQLATLAHEIAHANCDIKDCKCMKNPNHKQREIHAYKFTLSWLLKHKQRDVLRREMNSIAVQSSGCSCSEYYILASRHVMKLKLWRKCLKYVGTL